MDKKQLEARDNQLMVGGESTGGVLKAEVNIAFQMLLYPMIHARMIRGSAKENNAPI